MAAPTEFDELPFVARIIARLLMAIFAAALATSFIVLIFYIIHLLMDAFDVSGARFRFPFVALFAPLVGFFYGWKIGPLLYNYLRYSFHYSIWFRAFIFGSLFYLLASLIFIEIVHPLKFTQGIFTTSGYYWERNAISLIKIIFLPILLLGAGMVFWRKVQPPSVD